MERKEAERLEVNIKWNGKANVCVHCGNVPETFYIVTGHDHTDDEIRWCPCRDTDEIAHLRQQVATLTEQRDALLRSADYWKAEHLAGNEVIKKLTEQRDELKCLLEEAEYYVSSPSLIVEIEEALAAIQSSEVAGCQE